MNPCITDKITSIILVIILYYNLECTKYLVPGYARETKGHPKFIPDSVESETLLLSVLIIWMCGEPRSDILAWLT